MQYINIGFAIWLLLLSAVVFWIFNYFRRLSGQVEKGNLIRVLKRVLDKQEKNAKEIRTLKKDFVKALEEAKLHVQKVGLVRFNPFEEMGGDHSFSLALLDGKEDGFVITGLHTRERTRVYIKAIKKGKSKVDLAKEEEKAVKIALRGR